MRREHWRDVVGWEGWYQISDRGNLRSVDRQIVRSNGWPQSFRGRSMSPAPSFGGYLGYVLRRKGKWKRLYIHTMVLEAFDGPRPTPKHQARHLDGNNRNNAAENLAWGTKVENEADKLRHGTDQKTVSNRLLQESSRIKNGA